MDDLFGSIEYLIDSNVFLLVLGSGITFVQLAVRPDEIGHWGEEALFIALYHDLQKRLK